ncbi:MAG: DUF4998 domain-containing protein [Odoribacteraceae bacterium]|nr:DUF4998 domain-containing protein [Odoribacteraceae bacterium]
MAIIFCIIASCSKMDAYKEIAGDKELSYPGKIENVVIYSGDGRVIVSGDFISDPKVVNCRIYWDLKEKWLDVAVDMSGGPQSLYQEIVLPEKTYNFDIYTRDSKGNYSVPVHGSGKSYGNKYRASISNRLVKSAALLAGVATIEWYQLDRTQGPVETSLEYTNNSNEKVTITIPLGEQTTTLDGYKIGTDISYFTRYRPTPGCIDIFQTGTEQVNIH